MTLPQLYEARFRQANSLKLIPISRISPSKPYEVFDRFMLNKLAANIVKAGGFVFPLVVKQVTGSDKGYPVYIIVGSSFGYWATTAAITAAPTEISSEVQAIIQNKPFSCANEAIKCLDRQALLNQWHTLLDMRQNELLELQGLA